MQSYNVIGTEKGILNNGLQDLRRLIRTADHSGGAI
jgi:hypothetical protein